MLTEAMVAKALASTAAGAVKGAALAKVKDLLARFDSDARFQAAVAADREQILWTLLEVIITIGRAPGRKDLDGEQAVQALLAMATDPSTVRRVRALLNEAAVSADDRVAMLAVGYFVGAEPPSLRERLDWALRGLFPADADVLGTVVEQEAKLGRDQGLLALDLAGRSADTCVLVPSVNGQPLGQTGPRVSSESLRALGAAQCVDLAGAARDVWTTSTSDIERTTPVRLVPLGRELHRILGSIDWKDIAKRRAGNAVV